MLCYEIGEKIFVVDNDIALPVSLSLAAQRAKELDPFLTFYIGNKECGSY